MKKKNLLLELLEGFSNKELTQMKKLISSPYWNLKPDYKSFLNKLIRVMPKNRMSYCLREARKDGKNFEYKRRKLTSFIKDFIILISNRKDSTKTLSISRTLQLISFYNERGLDSNYRQSVTALLEQLEEGPQDLDTSFYKFQLYEIQATQSRTWHKPMTELPKMLWTLEQFYQEQNYRINCEFKSQAKGINASYSVSSSKGIIYIILSHLHRILNDGSKEEKETSYLYLKSQLFETNRLLGLDIKKMIYIHLINYIITKINVGIQHYPQEYNLLVNEMIKEELFLENNRLDYARFRNTILIYAIENPCNTKKIRGFIKVYLPKLKAKHPEIIASFYEAYLLMLDKNYDKASDILDKIYSNDWVNLEDDFHKIQLKKLELQLLYLKYSHRKQNSSQIAQDKQKIQNKINTFRSFLNSQIQIQNNGSLELCRAFAKLLRRQTFYKDVTIQQIDNMELPLSDKFWFHQILNS